MPNRPTRVMAWMAFLVIALTICSDSVTGGLPACPSGPSDSAAPAMPPRPAEGHWRIVAADPVPVLSAAHDEPAIVSVGAGGVWVAGTDSKVLRDRIENTAVLLRFDGERLRRVRTPAAERDSRFSSLFATPSGELWLPGQNGNRAVVYRSDSGRWTTARSLPDHDGFGFNVDAGLAISGDDVWMYEPLQMMHYDGREWREPGGLMGDPHVVVSGMAGQTADDMWAVGEWDTTPGVSDSSPIAGVGGTFYGREWKRAGPPSNRSDDPMLRMEALTRDAHTGRLWAVGFTGRATSPEHRTVLATLE
ncbi:hypothetical protein GCM10023196_084950 [Actinoallomurus vinaceus]|uniref:Uncharacterized protein n=1 Tax=Actinoallomurus vinaceus TaxID=1080074 RepID=A0ABP8UPD6_9ACTN